jgi:flagellar basal-body rod protein FlgF
MENLNYIGLSQQMALYHQMDVVANNIANMNTPGYKSQDLLFKQYLNNTSEDGEKISQVQDYGTYRDTSQGSLTQTSNKLDIAIEGPGYFGVQTAQGVRYTRAGAFSLDGSGNLVTQAGDQVQSIGSGSINIPQGTTQITIATNGDVSTELGPVGTIKLVTFPSDQALVATGGDLYDAQGAAEQTVSTPQLKQGFVESSNVQPITEMNKMLQITRMYEAVQHMLLNDHDDARQMIQKLTSSS